MFINWKNDIHIDLETMAELQSLMEMGTEMLNELTVLAEKRS